ncbi:uncharacterized protein V6R79_005656 [Siganus canaliculatus]
MSDCGLGAGSLGRLCVLVLLPTSSPGNSFPGEIAATNLRPDLLLWTPLRKGLLIIALTVPWEGAAEEAYERKKLRYNDLEADADQQGCNAQWLTNQRLPSVDLWERRFTSWLLLESCRVVTTVTVLKVLKELVCVSRRLFFDVFLLTGPVSVLLDELVPLPTQLQASVRFFGFLGNPRLLDWSVGWRATAQRGTENAARIKDLERITSGYIVTSSHSTEKESSTLEYLERSEESPGAEQGDQDLAAT